MYQKCLMFDKGNVELLNKIMSETSPTNIKKYGRCVKNYDQIKWNECRYNITVECQS